MDIIMKLIKKGIALIIYAFLIATGYWSGGTGVKDEWDNLMKWANKEKK